MHPESLELFMTQSPDVSSPHLPGAAAASQPPSGLPAPLVSTLAWPAVLLTPPPLAVPASSVFLCSPCKRRVIRLSEKLSGVYVAPRLCNQSHLGLRSALQLTLYTNLGQIT